MNAAIKITERDGAIIDLLFEGMSNREIGAQLVISERTVKSHLVKLYIRAGIKSGDKRVKLVQLLAPPAGEKEPLPSASSLTTREFQLAVLAAEGKSNRQIATLLGTSEQVVKNHFRNVFDKLGLWSRMELALYMRDRGYGMDAATA